MSKVADQKRKVILQACGLGELLTLYGIKLKLGKWRFSLEEDGQMVAEDVEDDLLDELLKQSEDVGSWKEALGLLDKHTWTQYSPTKVHQDFKKKIWSAIKERNPNPSKRWQHWQLEKWRLLCQTSTQNKKTRIPAKKRIR